MGTGAMNESVGFYWHISYWCKYRATYLAETNITFKQQYTFKFYKYTFKQHQAQATKYFEVQATKYDKLLLRVQCPVQSVAIFKLFSVDAINWRFLYLFLLASLE